MRWLEAIFLGLPVDFWFGMVFFGCFLVWFLSAFWVRYVHDHVLPSLKMLNLRWPWWWRCHHGNGPCWQEVLKTLEISWSQGAVFFQWGIRIGEMVPSTSGMVSSIEIHRIPHNFQDLMKRCDVAGPCLFKRRWTCGYRQASRSLANIASWLRSLSICNGMGRVMINHDINSQVESDIVVRRVSSSAGVRHIRWPCGCFCRMLFWTAGDLYGFVTIDIRISNFPVHKPFSIQRIF